MLNEVFQHFGLEQGLVGGQVENVGCRREHGHHDHSANHLQSCRWQLRVKAAHPEILRHFIGEVGDVIANRQAQYAADHTTVSALLGAPA